MDPLIILLAFVAGLAFRRIGYPPLPGYLIAGFVAHELGLGDLTLITHIADLGLLLLLFTIGLKLNFREIAAPQVWGVAFLQIAIAVSSTAVVILLAGMMFPVLAIENATTAWVLALAFSFSSTVFAVKVFEDRGEAGSFHATIAIGILVIQDIIAVVYLVISTGVMPSPWALALLLLIPARPLLIRIQKYARHGELVPLFGFLMAIGGAAVFEAVHLKGGLGALLLGALLASAPQSKELYNNMIDLKDLFLIGFFLQIGYYGLPTNHMWLVALALAILIFLRPIIYVLLFVAFRLRARTSVLASSALFNYSEFGLVVAAYAVSDGLLPPEWLTTIAIAVTLSFFFATPLNARIHTIYSHFGGLLQRFEREGRLEQELTADLGDADVVVLGMGRVGRGAYERLREICPDQNLVGVEEDYSKVHEHQEAGLNCVHGDASDHDFWAHSGLKDKKLVLISLTKHSENLVAIDQARHHGFKGTLAVVSRYPDEQKELEKLGCVAFNLYGEAGHGFAEHIATELNLATG